MNASLARTEFRSSKHLNLCIRQKNMLVRKKGQKDKKKGGKWSIKKPSLFFNNKNGRAQKKYKWAQDRQNKNSTHKNC